MACVILGITGYLGCNLAVHLANSGYKVIGIIRKESDLSKLERRGGIFLVENDETSVMRLFTENEIDCIINTVCAYQVVGNTYNNMIESNLKYPLRILDYAVAAGVSNFITMGTGLPDDFNMYSFTKKKFSEFGAFYARNREFNFCELQLEMFYGRNEPKNRFLRSSALKMLRGEAVPLTEGTQKRDIVYIDDVLGIIEHVIKQMPKGYSVIPVGTGTAPTIREIVEYMKDCLNSKSELLFGSVPMRVNEPDCIADITALTQIGYRLKYTWQQGIEKMCKEDI